MGGTSVGTWKRWDQFWGHKASCVGEQANHKMKWWGAYECQAISGLHEDPGLTLGYSHKNKEATCTDIDR